MIVYIDVKNGKVDLTKDQLEKLLQQKYDEGYEFGRKIVPATYTPVCPYSYWTCPYRWTNQPYITWTSSNSSSSSLNNNETGICSDSITSTTGTVTINYNEVS